MQIGKQLKQLIKHNYMLLYSRSHDPNYVNTTIMHFCEVNSVSVSFFLCPIHIYLECNILVLHFCDRFLFLCRLGNCILMISLLSPGYFISIHQGASGGLLISSLGGRWVQARCSSGEETGKTPKRCTSSLLKLPSCICLVPHRHLFISTKWQHQSCLRPRPVTADRRGHETEPLVPRAHCGPDSAHGRREGH